MWSDLPGTLRLIAIGASAQFVLLSLFAALMLWGYYYRGWTEKIATTLARAVLLFAPWPPLLAVQVHPVYGPRLYNDGFYAALVLLLFGGTLAMNWYAFWRLYWPKVRNHPAYRMRHRRY